MISMKFLAGIALALGLSSNANAAIPIFTDQASFLAALSAPAVDTFQDLSIGTSLPALTRAIGPYGYTASTDVSTLYGVGAPANPWLSSEYALATITFGNFTGGVVGLGGDFFTTMREGNHFPGTVTLTATDADGSVSRQIVNASTSSFLGFLSTSGLTSVNLSAVQPVSQPLWPTADNLILGGQISSAVPEPATWAMMIIGFGAIGSMVRASRRRNAVAAA